jgi:transposase
MEGKGGGVYSVEMYQRVRRACHVEGMSVRKAAQLFGMHRRLSP